MTAGMLVIGPQQSLAASVSIEVATVAKDVSGTPYTLHLLVQGDDATITLSRKHRTTEALQQHVYRFELSEASFPRDLESGTLQSDGAMGDFGVIALDFNPTSEMTRKTSCGGSVITRTRGGLLQGTLRLKPDGADTDYFGTIQLSRLRTKVTRVTDKGCTTKKQTPCPADRVALFAGPLRAIKLSSGKVRVEVHVAEARPPALFIEHSVVAAIDDPTKMSYSDDLAGAQANFSVASPFASGTVDFTATDPATDVGNGNCANEETWTTTARTGSVAGTVEIHFDSFGDVTRSPASGFLQSWQSH